MDEGREEESEVKREGIEEEEQENKNKYNKISRRRNFLELRDLILKGKQKS